MADIAAIRQALADNLGEVALQMQISPYRLPNPFPPCAYVIPTEQLWPDGQRVDIETFHFKVVVLVANNDDVAAQQLLDQLLASDGEFSIKAAIESDPELGGNADDLQVLKAEIGHLTKADAPTKTALGAEWTVAVYP